MPVGYVASLARHIGLLLDDDAAARVLAARARERVEQAFSTQTVGAQLHELLRDRAGFEAPGRQPIRS